MHAHAVVLLAALGSVAAQTYKRLGTCPTLGCVFPPDQASFLPGQYFDVRLEVHAPVNGSEAFNNGVVDEEFTFCIQVGDGKCEDASVFFKVSEPEVDTYNFTYVESVFK